MSDSGSTYLLDQLATAQRQAEVVVNELSDALSPAGFLGRRASTSSGLTWGYYGGRYGGNTYAHATHVLAASTTYYQTIPRFGTGGPTVETTQTKWNDIAHYARGYRIVTGASAVTSYEDHRCGPYGVLWAREPAVYTTAVGNVGTGEDNLITHTVEAGVLSAGKGIAITAWGTSANTANAKTLRLYFGTVAILATALTVSQAGAWRIQAEVISTGTDAQDYVAQLMQGGTTTLIYVAVGALTQDDGATISVKCTGEATANDDVRQEGLIVRYFG